MNFTKLDILCIKRLPGRWILERDPSPHMDKNSIVWVWPYDNEALMNYGAQQRPVKIVDLSLAFLRDFSRGSRVVA